MSPVRKPRWVGWLGCVLVLALGWLLLRWQRQTGPIADPASEIAVQRQRANVARLEAHEQHIAETVWATELLAQSCGRTVEALWDSLNAATNKLVLLAAVPARQVILGDWRTAQPLPHGIELRASTGRGPTLGNNAWGPFVAAFEQAGWRLDQVEFRHNRFELDAEGRPRQSVFWFSAHLTQPARSRRATLEGDLVLDWAPPTAAGQPPTVHRVDASGLTLKTRQGEPFFQPLLVEEIVPDAQAYFIDPLLLYDLDGDGLSEIILAVKNLVYRRDKEGRFRSAPLCRHSPGLIYSGVIGDFDGDGHADFLCAKTEGILLFKGSARGTFDDPPRMVWHASEPLRNVMVMTCGDIDHDGDLDVFLGQYRVPSLGQVLRPHYYDANDGHPAFLLRNDGAGNLTDATADSGLAPKRARRIFSASLADLDRDGNLDLLMISDFAGIDLFAGDGRGHFRDVTADWITEPHGFGMGLALADFNADGLLDFLMIGMNSPTADRLEHLGLTRPGTDEDPTMRRRMTQGNRLCLARPGGGFDQPAASPALSRTGWSWGVTADDFDNDGFPDCYIATGHQSKESVRDYEPEFWLHDIYVDAAVADADASGYFLAKFARTRGSGWSYSGYEKNRLVMNQGGVSFVEVGHLAGVALEADSRNAVADDLDGDGRLDLLVTTFEVWPEVRQTLRVYRNALADTGHWIGFRFREEPRTCSPVGVRVELHTAGHRAVRQLVTGDGFRSQHANTLHFGLGKTDRVEEALVRWPNGVEQRLPDPQIDHYHDLRVPKARALTR